MLVPLFAQSEDDFEIKQNADNTVTITGYKGTIKEIIIPDTLYGLKVAIIGDKAFEKKGIVSVTIPETVTTIQERAFFSNEQLSRVILKDGLKNIESYAFSGSGLTEIIIPDSVTNIKFHAFAPDIDRGERGVLTNVILGKGLQTIEGSAFSYNQIVELNLPSSLTTIKDDAFSHNIIKNITFSTGLKTVGVHAFSNNYIVELNLPSSLATIEAYAFSENQIVELNLPSSLKVIGAGAFLNNELQSVTIPNGVISIDNYFAASWMGAFAGNPITAIVIPVSLAGNGKIKQYTPHGEDSAAFGKINGSIITSITIPVEMNENTLRGNFEESFVNFWISQNREGGTYVKRGPIWSK